MEFTERDELSELITETKKMKCNLNQFNQKEKIPEQLDNLNTLQLLDIQLKMLQDDFNFESDEDENDFLINANESNNIWPPQPHQTQKLKEEEQEKQQSLINDMLDDFSKEEILAIQKQDFLSKRCQTVVKRIDNLLFKDFKNRTASCNVLKNLASKSLKNRTITHTNQINNLFEQNSESN